MTELTQQRLRQVLRYDPETGIFVHVITRGRAYAGKTAGSRAANGYVYIGLDGKDYLAHRLAWFYMNGEWPVGIDHENLLRDDNRFSNLRLASKSQNARNYSMSSHNTSGIRGVSFHKAAKKWRADICINGVDHYLGLFEEKDEARIAYLGAAHKLFGEFKYVGGA